MRIEKREKKVYEEIYIADDGTQFDTKRHCLEYEKEIEMCKKAKSAEKLRIRELDDMMPLINVETYIKTVFEYSKDFTVPDGYPTLYCVESFGYDNIYEDDNTWTCTIDECKDAAVKFWGKFGYKLIFEKIN